MLSDQVIEILNRDERARKLIQRFEDSARNASLSGAEYEEARKTVVLLAAAGNQEVMSLMAADAYEELSKS